MSCVRLLVVAGFLGAVSSMRVELNSIVEHAMDETVSVARAERGSHTKNTRNDASFMYSHDNALGKALPPGYEDELYCPPDFCMQNKLQPPGLTGPRSGFFECKHKAGEKDPLPVKAWGFLLPVEAKEQLMTDKYHQEECSQHVDGEDKPEAVAEPEPKPEPEQEATAVNPAPPVDSVKSDCEEITPEQCKEGDLADKCQYECALLDVGQIDSGKTDTLQDSQDASPRAALAHDVEPGAEAAPEPEPEPEATTVNPAPPVDSVKSDCEEITPEQCKEGDFADKCQYECALLDVGQIDSGKTDTLQESQDDSPRAALAHDVEAEAEAAPEPEPEPEATPTVMDDSPRAALAHDVEPEAEAEPEPEPEPEATPTVMVEGFPKELVNGTDRQVFNGPYRMCSKQCAGGRETYWWNATCDEAEEEAGPDTPLIYYCGEDTKYGKIDRWGISIKSLLPTIRQGRCKGFAFFKAGDISKGEAVISQVFIGGVDGTKQRWVKEKDEAWVKDITAEYNKGSFEGEITCTALG